MEQRVNPFEIEIPEPGDIFVSTYEHPHNRELVEGDPKARKLSKQALKIADKRIADISENLAKYRYFEAIETIEKYQEKEKDWRRQAKNALEDNQLKLYEKINTGIQKVSKRIEELQAYVSPARKAAIYLDRLQKRRAEHDIAVANENLYRRLRKQMRKEIRFFAQTIVRRWGALGFHHRVTRGNRTKTYRPQIEKCVYTEDEIQFKIAVKELSLLRSSVSLLPEGVYARDLVKPETLYELESACERPVTSPHNDEDLGWENGVFIVVHRAGMLDGLFLYIRLADVLVKYNQADREKFPFPVGIKRGRVAQFAYLSEQPHLMFNGITGSGKTNAIRAILTTLIQYHSPDELRLFITDLKRGSDFNYYVDVPHLEGEILHDVNQVEALSEKLVRLMHYRMNILKRRGVVDILAYNSIAEAEEKLARIILVIDECGAIKSLAAGDLAQQNAIWRNLSLIATQARAAGIHLFLGTQQASGNTIPANVRDNITFLLSGQQRTFGASMSTTGDWRLKRMGKVKGRMYCYEYGDEYMIQTPHAHEDDIKKALDIARSYPKPSPVFANVPDDLEVPAYRPFGEAFIIELALLDFDGELSGQDLYSAIKHPDSSRDKIYSLIKGIVNKGQVEFEGKKYQVETMRGNKKRLVEIYEDSVFA